MSPPHPNMDLLAVWTDTHAHLSDPKFDTDRHVVLDRAFEAGIQLIIEIADGPQEWEKARQLAELYPQKLYWTGGFHPYFADQVTVERLAQLKRLANHAQFVAIGEVGLDYAKASLGRDIQQDSFIKSIESAFDLGKPLVVHCREAYPDLLSILEKKMNNCPDALASCPGVIHCFSGTGDEAKALLALGFYIGVDAPITYPSAKRLREALAHVPIEKIVLETDSPYLPPQAHRGKRNEPAYIPMIAKALAELKNIPVGEVQNISYQNTLALYRIKPLVKSQ